MDSSRVMGIRTWWMRRSLVEIVSESVRQYYRTRCVPKEIKIEASTQLFSIQTAATKSEFKGTVE